MKIVIEINGKTGIFESIQFAKLCQLKSRKCYSVMKSLYSFNFINFFFIVLKLNFQIYNITFYVALIAYFESLDSCKL